MKCVLRASSSQCSPQIMHAWGKKECVILLFQKEYAGTRVKADLKSQNFQCLKFYKLFVRFIMLLVAPAPLDL